MMMITGIGVVTGGMEDPTGGMEDPTGALEDPTGADPTVMVGIPVMAVMVSREPSS